jgi:hypothetical protein
MTVRQARPKARAKPDLPKEMPPALLEGSDPITVCVGSLYAYDMVLSIEACSKNPEELIGWYRKTMEAKYPLETDRKSAFASTESQLRTIAAGQDESQSAAAKKLLEAWKGG